MQESLAQREKDR